MSKCFNSVSIVFQAVVPSFCIKGAPASNPFFELPTACAAEQGTSMHFVQQRDRFVPHGCRCGRGIEALEAAQRCVARHQVLLPGDADVAAADAADAQIQELKTTTPRAAFPKPCRRHKLRQLRHNGIRIMRQIASNWFELALGGILVAPCRSPAI